MAICKTYPLPLDGPNTRKPRLCQRCNPTLVKATKTSKKLSKEDIPYNSNIKEASPKASEKACVKWRCPSQDLEKTQQGLEKRNSPLNDSERQNSSQQDSRGRNSLSKISQTSYEGLENRNSPLNDSERQNFSQHDSRGRNFPSKTGQTPYDQPKIRRHQEAQTKISRSPIRNRKKPTNLVVEQDDKYGSKQSTQLLKDQEAQVSLINVKDNSTEYSDPKKFSPKKKRAPEIPIENTNNQQNKQSSQDSLPKRLLNKWCGGFTKSGPSSPSPFTNSTPQHDDSPAALRQPQFHSLPENKQTKNGKFDDRERIKSLDPEKTGSENRSPPAQISIVQVRPETEATLIEELTKVQKGDHGGTVNTIIVPAMGPSGMPLGGGNLNSLHEIIRAEARSCNRGLEEVLNEVNRLKRDVRELKEMCEMFMKLSKETLLTSLSVAGKQNSLLAVQQPKSEEKAAKKKFWKKFKKSKKAKAPNLENGKG